MYITFNPEDTSELVSNSESQVVFYSWVYQDFAFTSHFSFDVITLLASWTGQLVKY